MELGTVDGFRPEAISQPWVAVHPADPLVRRQECLVLLANLHAVRIEVAELCARADEIVGLGAVGFLQKPFHLEEIRQGVMDAVW